MNAPIIILGAGLSGLATAYYLQKEGFDTIILEARDRPGGRMHTLYQADQAPIEMGATWLGKKHLHLTNLLEELGIGIFEQYLGPAAIYEPISTSPPQLATLPHNPDPSYRIQGGSSNLINTLLDHLDASKIYFGKVVKEIRQQENGLQVITTEDTFAATTVISTLPPRLLIKTVKIGFSLGPDLLEVAQHTHTWMGESIKVALSYAQPYWRKPSTSGTIFSNVGPVSEMYDHSDYDLETFAIKGFLNGALHSAGKEKRLELILKQLKRYFGAQVDDYLSYEEQVWSQEAYTYVPYDGYILPHQHNGHPIYQQSFLNGKFFVAGSETAASFPGYMDGAVESAQFVCQQLRKT